MKRYDRAYFDRWYRDPDSRVLVAGSVDRKAALAVSAAEYLLGRPVRSVLDVCCGEAAWRAPLLKLRPRLRYQGVDSSAYAVRRFGRSRGIIEGRFGDLPRLGLDGPFDLVVCADAVHYIPTPELKLGLSALARLTIGMAWIELFAASDDSIGDAREYQRRSTATYDRMFRHAGLTPIGLYGFVPRAVRETLMAFERGR